MSLTERDAKRPRVTLIAKSQAQDHARSTARHEESNVSVATVIQDLEALLEKQPRGNSERKPQASEASSPQGRLLPAPAAAQARPRTQTTIKKASLTAVGKKSGVSSSFRHQVDSPPNGKKQETGVASNDTPRISRTTSATRSGTSVPSSKTSAPAVAHFDVCGQIFKCSAKWILAQPDTLLAKLLSEAVGQPDKTCPIAVDVSPERFQHILDWYRYGELFLPQSISAEAVLRDAARLELPEEIVINGVSRSTDTSHTAHKVGRDLIAAVLNRWPSFDSFLAGTLLDIAKHFEKVGLKSATSTAAEEVEDEVAEESFDFPRFALPVFGEDGCWLSSRDVCSTPRARVLALKLEELGYRCEFTETELLIGLPLKLCSETAAVNSFPPGGETEDGQEANKAAS
eukprot:TRINITY_DN48254_c0_g1_i1.p1 TRINITY_DN48254_c0_g1~~TRINITY_DN48254_c0_g1_i1.p1  ORF type:complete len:401 (+),score=84.41 TRINITY_DN48254_c0_g1_i1:34-1236(+)